MARRITDVAPEGAGCTLLLLADREFEYASHRLPERSWAIRLPTVHYLIDAMNVIATRGNGWWRDRHRAMSDFVRLLDRWSAQSAHEVTVVFESPLSKPIRSQLIEVSWAPKARRDSADEEIVRRLGAESDRGEIVVVTSDRLLADRVRALGGTVRSARAFRGELDAL